jgi:hypothetical protein
MRVLVLGEGERERKERREVSAARIQDLAVFGTDQQKGIVDLGAAPAFIRQWRVNVVRTNKPCT